MSMIYLYHTCRVHPFKVFVKMVDQWFHRGRLKGKCEQTINSKVIATNKMSEFILSK